MPKPVMPETLEEYIAIQIAGMARHVAETPALDYAILTIHDNDMKPVKTMKLRRTFSGGVKYE